MQTILKKSIYAVILLLFFVNSCKNTSDVPTTVSLPRSVPEAEGVSSQGILDFLDAAAKSRHEFHSFMFLRHGKVIAEGWWNPYAPELKHTMYSLSKSFTSTAIGLAVNEKRLTINDKVISFFPKELPDSVSPFLSEMTVRNLLTMSAGQVPDPTFTITANDSNWVKSFLALPVVNEPDTKFLYNSMASYMLSAIVQKVTGQKEIDYLTPRLFQPLGILGIDWEVDPKNINTGGWGLRIKTEDMAKFGQLYLQKGKWNNKQLLPSTWVEEATTTKIQQAPDLSQAAKDT
ncbi:MAG: serine hydrolase, partial [Bacteroidales bacterium]|nr:serine hydrolase [Bacteroidales bacterium]